MSTRRILLGKRGDGTTGLFVAKSGFDAMTASDDDLLMNMNQFTEQMIMFGQTISIPPSGTVIPFGFTNVPFVILTGTNLTISIATGGDTQHSTFSNVAGMFIRPYPPIGSANKSVVGAVSASSMSITCPGQQTSVASFAVFRKRLQ
jgi:hypothetical protein